MARPRRAWVTPDTPTPEDFRSRCISVPNDQILVGAVTGALLPLTDESSWEQTGSMTAAEAAEIMQAAVTAFLDSTCDGGSGECPPITLPDEAGPVTRLNPSTYKFEKLDEEFGYWVPFWSEEEWPVTAPRAEEEEPDALCAAATNAEYVLHTVFLGVVSYWEDDIGADVAAINTAGAIATLIGLAFTNPVTAAIAGAAGLFALGYDTISGLFTDFWDEKFSGALRCTLLENATLTESGAVHFDYTAVNKGILESLWTKQSYMLLVSQVLWMMHVISADGLDAAGATTALEGDCSTCGTWQATFEIATNLDLTAWSVTKGDVLADGSVRMATGNPPTIDSSYGWNASLQFVLTVDTTNCTIDRVDFKGTIAAGGGDSYDFVRVGNPQEYFYNRGYNYLTDAWHNGTGLLSETTTTDETRVSYSWGIYGNGRGVVTGLRLSGKGKNPFGANN